MAASCGSLVQPLMGMDQNANRLQIGDRIGDLRVIEEIGAGAFGRVYRAHDSLIGRDVALKVISGLSTSDQGANAVRRELKILGTMNHPHIVSLFRVHTRQDTWMLELELVDGRTLKETVASSGPLTAKSVYLLAIQMLEALDVVHRGDIVHCDIKADNVLMCGDSAKLTDFGLGKKVTEASLNASSDVRLAGTPQYMAPEILLSHRATPASDLWSLGVLLHFALTGVVPFDAEDLPSLFHAIHNNAPPPIPASTPNTLRRLLSALLVKDPNSRPQTASDARAILEGTADPALTSSSHLAPALVGRGSVTREIEQQMEVPVRDHGPLLVVEGERGIGRSSVLNKIQRQAKSRGELVLALRLDPTRDVPRAVLQLVAGASRNVKDVEGILWALEQDIVSARRLNPVVMIIDDAQFASASDMRILESLCWRVTGAGAACVVAIATGRFSEGTSSHACELRLDTHPKLTRLKLDRLSEEDTFEVLSAHFERRSIDPTVSSALLDASAGVPGILLDIVAGLVNADAISVQRHRVVPTAAWHPSLITRDAAVTVQRNLSRVAENERDLLDAAAVLGLRFQTRHLFRVLEWSLLETLRALEHLSRERNLVLPDESGYRFAHPLVRQVIYDGVGLDMRTYLHEQFATLLEGAAERNEAIDSWDVAYHWSRAGRPERARTYAATAVEQSVLGAEDNRVIERAHEAGLLDDTISSEESLRYKNALILLSRKMLDMGDEYRANGLLARLAQAAEECGDTNVVMEVSVWRESHAYNCGGHSAVNMTLLQHTLRQIENSPTRRRGLHISTLVYRAQSATDQVTRTIEQLRKASQAAGAPLEEAQALALGASVDRSQRNFESACDKYANAASMFEKEHHLLNASVCRVNYGTTVLAMGDLDERHDRELRSAIAVLERLGASRMEIHARTVAANMLYSRAQLPDARAQLDIAIALIGPPSDRDSRHYNTLALAAHVTSILKDDASISLLKRWRASTSNSNGPFRIILQELHEHLLYLWTGDRQAVPIRDWQQIETKLASVSQGHRLDNSKRVSLVCMLGELTLSGAGPFPGIVECFLANEFDSTLKPICTLAAKGLDKFPRSDLVTLSKSLAQVPPGQRHFEYQCYASLLSGSARSIPFSHAGIDTIRNVLSQAGIEIE